MGYPNNFLVVRYIVFGLFTMCNAIICSVAVWNFGLVHSAKPFYLIFLGGFSLVSIITLAFVELLCVNPFTTRVWFEFAWVTLFWVMELVGGAALIAIESELPCSRQTALCTSGRVILAFTWMCTIILLVYLLVLVFTVASQHHEDVKVWLSDVRTLRPSAARQYPPPQLPSAIQFEKCANVDNYTSIPLRSPPMKILRHLGAEYQIEPHLPVFVAPEQMDISHSSNLPEAIPLPPLAAAPVIPSMKRIPSLPQGVINAPSSLGLSTVPQEHVSFRGTSLPLARQSNLLASPSPLGDWPRQDVMKQSVKHKRKSPPSSAFEFPKSHTTSVGPADRVLENVQPRPRRPSGPRSRLPSEESGHRPARLDLSGISNYEAGRRVDDAAAAR